MASKDDQKETYSDTLLRQMRYFLKHFGCSTSPSFYYIHYHDGRCHWIPYSWGWNLSCLNIKDGDPTQCGQSIFGGTAICQRCYKEKADVIQQICHKFNQEMKENHQEVIDDIIAEGRKIRVIRLT